MTARLDKTGWIAADWGTSHLRLWRIARSGAVLGRIDSDQGMGRLAPSEFEPVLLGLLENDLPTDGHLTVICCGMAGSRQGWSEAHYVPVPATPPGIAEATLVRTHSPKIAVHILPGLSQTQPADVMRGEEAQIAGYLTTEPGFDGVICLPGTHSKWAHVSAGEVVSFRTFMTGELFSLLSGHSVLRHSVGATGWDEAAFAEAVTHAMSRPAAIAADLFTLRAEALLADLPPETARARLSGLLIGIELAAARPYWLGQAIAILGETGIASAYAQALVAQGCPATMVNAEEMTLNGLRAAYAQLREHSL